MRSVGSGLGEPSPEEPPPSGQVSGQRGLHQGATSWPGQLPGGTPTEGPPRSGQASGWGRKVTARVGPPPSDQVSGRGGVFARGAPSAGTTTSGFMLKAGECGCAPHTSSTLSRRLVLTFGDLLPVQQLLAGAGGRLPAARGGSERGGSAAGELTSPLHCPTNKSGLINYCSSDWGVMVVTSRFPAPPPEP